MLVGSRHQPGQGLWGEVVVRVEEEEVAPAGQVQGPVAGVRRAPPLGQREDGEQRPVQRGQPCQLGRAAVVRAVVDRDHLDPQRRAGPGLLQQ